jgi:hypothetical protein
MARLRSEKKTSEKLRILRSILNGCLDFDLITPPDNYTVYHDDDGYQISGMSINGKLILNEEEFQSWKSNCVQWIQY